MHLIAIDWSGNETVAGQRKHIWMASWHGGIVTLSNERTRNETVKVVIAAAHQSRSLVVGLDFSFSFPAWFARELGCATVADVWRTADAHREAWLRACKAPFWGRPGTRRPEQHYGGAWLGFRQTERAVGARTGRMPTSTFQIGGAGAVGTGSLRGMPHLLELQAAGISVWPFDSAGASTAIEIYPRIFTGRTNVSDAAARARHLEQDPFNTLPSAVLSAARNSPDAFDALCALMGMARHASALAGLTCATDPVRLLEGEIWMPREM